MFGTSATPGREATATEEARSSTEMQSSTNFASPTDANSGGEKRTSRAGSPPGTKNGEEVTSGVEKKRRSSGVAKARDILSSAKQSLHLHSSSASSASGVSEKAGQSPIQRLGKGDPALSVPQGSLNNSAGESAPGPKSTFRVGVTEDKNKKCRRTMEDTHAYLYNFLSTPAPALGSESGSKNRTPPSDSSSVRSDVPPVLETDNGYFAIFDGHAGTFAADWCGKKLHVILEDNIRRNPNTPIPELLDLTFTSVDQQLEKLPVKNSGCTAVIAVLRWEDRVPNSQSATGSSSIAPATAAAIRANADSTSNQAVPRETTGSGAGQAEVKSSESRQHDGRPDHGEAPAEVRLRESATRQRVLYTANVGDARIVLCRNGRALRLSYDHKGSDENEGKRVANAGGLILNNRVNGVLAVTRALGDAYMKDLVTGHPYTTETVIQPDQDEFLILACDGVRTLCDV